MKPVVIVLGVFGAIALLVLGAVGSAVATYNDFVQESEAVDGQLHAVDVAYQRTFEIVPRITALAEQYLQQEKDVITNATALRSGLAPAQNGTFEAKDAYLSEVIQFVALVGNRVEAYPNLQAAALFQDVIYEIINSQNKVATEKLRYNRAVQTYNAHIRECCIPVFVAGLGGFDRVEYEGFTDRSIQTSFPSS